MLDEKQLIAGCIKNNLASQKALYERYAGKMLVVCMRYTKDRPEAEDILQEAFFKVFANLSKFRAEGSFEGWIRRIMVNTALKHHRKIKMYAITSLEEARLHNEDASALSDIGYEELLDMIQKLPDRYRVVFNLYIMDGYTHEQIAKLCNIATGTSKSTLSRARVMLQQQLLKREQADEQYYK